MRALRDLHPVGGLGGIAGVAGLDADADGQGFFQRLAAREVDHFHDRAQALASGGRHIAVHGGHIERGVVKVRVLDGGEVFIVGIPDHLELDGPVLERAGQGPPTVVGAGDGEPLVAVSFRRRIGSYPGQFWPKRDEAYASRTVGYSGE